MRPERYEEKKERSWNLAEGLNAGQVFGKFGQLVLSALCMLLLWSDQG